MEVLPAMACDSRLLTLLGNLYGSTNRKGAGRLKSNAPFDLFKRIVQNKCALFEAGGDNWVSLSRLDGVTI